MCLFSEKAAGYRDTLRTVSTNSAGKSLHDAIEISGNDELPVQLSSTVDLKDAHAIDIKYHKKCWGKNLSIVLRQPSTAATSSSTSLTAEVAAKIEFLTTTEIALKNGNLLIMSDLQAAYDSILKENGIQNKTCSRKLLKQLIEREIDDVEFHRPKRVNESERITIKETKDAVIQLLIQESDVKDNIKTLYAAALYLRKAFNKSKKWVFEGSLVGILSKDHFPEELYCFFRWVINGSNTAISIEGKCVL